jgi:hypothetical protein
VSYKRWELFTLSGHLCSPMFLVGSPCADVVGILLLIKEKFSIGKVKSSRLSWSFFLYPFVVDFKVKIKVRSIPLNVMLVLAHTNLPLSKANRNLVIQINKTRSFKC